MIESRQNLDPDFNPNAPILNEWLNGQGCTLTIPGDYIENPSTALADTRTLRFQVNVEINKAFQLAKGAGNTKAGEPSLDQLALLLDLARNGLSNKALLEKLQASIKGIFPRQIRSERMRQAAAYTRGEISLDELEDGMKRREELEKMILQESKI